MSEIELILTKLKIVSEAEEQGAYVCDKEHSKILLDYIQQKENIIKEVRKYISNTKMFTYGEEKEFFLKDYWYGKELLEILDKENI